MNEERERNPQWEQEEVIRRLKYMGWKDPVYLGILPIRHREWNLEEVRKMAAKIQ